MLLKYKADLLLTTEKDFVKLDDELKKITAVVQIEIEIIEAEKFFQFISNKLLLIILIFYYYENFLVLVSLTNTPSKSD